MKKLGKVVLYTLVTFIFVLVVLIVVAALAEKKIVKLALEQVSKTTDIPIRADEIDFTLVHNFPYATIRCTNLLVSSPETNGDFESDTLFYAERLFISVASKPLLKSIFEVKVVEMDNAEVFYSLDTAGISNINFLNDTTQKAVIDTSDNNIFLDIKEFNIQNFTCHYKDSQQKASANLFLEELNLSGLIDNDDYKGKAEGAAILTNCTFGTTNLYRMQKTVMDFKMAYNDNLLSIENADVAVDEDALFSLAGKFNLSDSTLTDVVLKAQRLDLGSLLKYLPENLLKEYGVTDFSGILVAEANISGFISDSIMPAVTATFDFSDGLLHYEDYPVLKQVECKGMATNGTNQNNSSTRLDISTMSFRTEKSKVSLSGNVNNLDKPAYQIKSTINIDLGEFADYVPDTLLQSIGGRVNAVFSTKGILPDSISDAFIHSVLKNSKASAQFQNIKAVVDSSMSVDSLTGKMEYLPNEIKLNDVTAFVPAYNLGLKNLDAVITGDPTKPDSLNIQFNRLRGAFEKSKFELSGSLKYPMNPDYSISGQAYVDLQEMQKYLPDSLVNSMAGTVSATFRSAAQLNLDSISDNMYELFFEKSSFSASFDNVTADMPDSTMSVSQLTGQLNYHADTFEIKKLGLNYMGQQFDMSETTVLNAYSAVLQNQAKELSVTGSFGVGDLDYAFLEQFMELDTSRVEELEAEPLNFTYKIKGKFKANSIKYGDALFQNIDSKFLLKTTSYVFDSLKLDAFEGTSLSSIKIEMLPDELIEIYFKTDVEKMNVSKMIGAFSEYIAYEDVKPENIQGIFSTKMDGKIVMKNFEPVYNSLLLNGDLTLENGALINVKPIMEVEKIPGIGLKNMDRLHFSTLNSSVFLFNQEVYIPRTEIKSTSFDAMFLGMYSFGEDYDYHIRMFLGEVLSSKSKANLRKQAQDNGFGEDVEADEKTLTKGRTSIYLVSKSENGKEKAGFDKKQDRANMKAKVNLQKQMVDMRFHPTLVKYDTEQ
ncbi:AsmA family protein [uncultured Draconibacterium sp.]|uniref:AsmA family protein n=1 Tax=uncultured Draconibacterium sp. TaxID=1573823 RepID=UPI003216D573